MPRQPKPDEGGRHATRDDLRQAAFDVCAAARRVDEVTRQPGFKPALISGPTRRDLTAAYDRLDKILYPPEMTVLNAPAGPPRDLDGPVIPIEVDLMPDAADALQHLAGIANTSQANMVNIVILAVHTMVDNGRIPAHLLISRQ